MIHYTLKQIQTFIKIACEHSVSKAAERLFVTQPAVSMQIKQLEDAFGLALIEPSGRNIRLTHAGEEFLTHAIDAIGKFKDLEASMAAHAGNKKGRIDLAIVSTAKYFLPHLLAEFKREHAGIDVKLVVGNRVQLLNLLERSEVDIAVMGRPPKKMATRSEPFAAHPHVFIAAPSHPLAGQNEVSVMSMLNEPFISREQGSGTRAALEKFLQRQTIELNIAMEADSNETIKQAVMAGMGISFLSLHTIGLELDHQLLKIIPVEGAPVVRKWNCVHTLSKMLSPAAESFRYFVLESGEAALAKQFMRHWNPTSVTQQFNARSI